MIDANATVPAQGPWTPLSPQEAAELLAGADFPWWIAGGFAIEWAVGEPYREHSDLDVLVLHRDQARVRRHFEGWDLFLADPPGAGRLRAWSTGEDLPSRVHDVWCRRSPDEPWSVQLMLDKADGEDWVSRRDSRVRRPLAQLGQVTCTGIPYLSPEVQLFYKAKNVREKDQLDFDRVLPRLDAGQRAWLVGALELALPGHDWLSRLNR
ncbi:nucleotidyltransferase domain-containing protein [Kitasatospora sp. NPDC048194]|uniref:nucleotidyltransferase domain-containing protein n=1 Tax=Kitasatospora sp. NPDC048194 TaxID=3364045 RepID=UPI003723D8B6